MRRTLLAFLAGVAIASGGTLAFASGHNSHRTPIRLHDLDIVVMPELRWQCSYVTSPNCTAEGLEPSRVASGPIPTFTTLW